jgi:hypothetical protein
LEVKSHTGAAYNDEKDAGARGKVDGDILRNITFTTADPPIGGLRSKPVTYDDKNDSKSKLSTLHARRHMQ